MSAEPTLVVRRMISASRDRVFAAWLDPASLAVWMCPGPVTGATAEVDARVGGRFRIVMRDPSGDAEHWGVYLLIDPPEKLSFTWLSAATDRRPTVVEVEFIERDGGTEIVLTHRQLPASQIESHRKGWTDIVEKLGSAVQRTGRP